MKKRKFLAYEIFLSGAKLEKLKFFDLETSS